MVTKQNTKMKGSTITGLRAVKAAVQDFGGVDKVPVTKENGEDYTTSSCLIPRRVEERRRKMKSKNKKIRGCGGKKTKGRGS